MTRRFLLSLPFVSWFVREAPAAPPPSDPLIASAEQYFNKRALEELSAQLKMNCLLRSEGVILLPSGRTIQFYRRKN